MSVPLSVMSMIWSPCSTGKLVTTAPFFLPIVMPVTPEPPRLVTRYSKALVRLPLAAAPTRWYGTRWASSSPGF